MKSKRRWISLVLALCLLALTACGSGGEKAETDAVKPEPAVTDRSIAPGDTGDSLVPLEADAPEEPEELKVYFLDVGQGDSALITCEGEAMMIDGGGADMSAKIFSFLKKQGIERLKYVIASHPEADHVGGLAAALNCAEAERAFCSGTEAEESSFADFVKYLKEQDVELEVPSAGTELRLGSALVRFIGPVKESADANNSSLIVKISYGDTSFLFMGDAGEPAENALLKAGADLTCNVVKIGHHGSQAASSEEFLRATGAEYAVISCAAANKYGHPADRTLKNIEDCGMELYRTDLNGDICFASDGEQITTVSTEKTSSSDAFATYFMLYGVLPDITGEEEGATSADNEEELQLVPTEDIESEKGTRTETDDQSEGVICSYVLNPNSKKFHYPECFSVEKMKEKNKIYFEGTRDEVIAMGYEPCGNCKP